jgi:hypothetical protein
LWRLHDGADGSSVFEIAVFRSFAASFWHALYSSAAEFRLAVTRDVDTCGRKRAAIPEQSGPARF